jgi:hypothetical protein
LFPVAVARALRDADAVLGERFITYEPDHDTEMFLVTIAPDVPRVPGFLRRPDGTGLGFSWHSDMTWPDIVVSAAESVQEAVIEDGDHWGMAFPPCPLHPNHPLDPVVVKDIACWTCPHGSIDPIEIGCLGAEVA